MSKKKLLEKKGFVLYQDTLETAINLLPEMEERGQLLTTIHQYVSHKEITSFSDRVNVCFAFIRDKINAANDLYKREQERRAEYYRKKNKNTDNTENTENTQKTVTEHETEHETKREINDVNLLKNNNIILSNNKKFSKKQVKEILEREGIFLKQISFDAFFELNSREYGWKYDPITAARSYIEKHAGCLSAVKNSPGAPPLGGPNKKPVLVEAQAADEFLKTAILKLSEFLSEADKKIFAQIQPIRLILGVETGKVVERNIAGRKTAVKEVKNKLILRVTDKVIATTIDENKIIGEYLTAQNTFIEWVF